MADLTAGLVRDKSGGSMSRFKEALERGKEARRRQVEHSRGAKTERGAPMATSTHKPGSG
jgi:hypothetical protein